MSAFRSRTSSSTTTTSRTKTKIKSTHTKVSADTDRLQDRFRASGSGTRLGDPIPSSSSDNDASDKDAEAKNRTASSSSLPRSSQPSSRRRLPSSSMSSDSDSGDDDDPDFGISARLSVRQEAERDLLAERIKKIKEWNREEKKKAKNEGREPRLKDVPKFTPKKLTGLGNDSKGKAKALVRKKRDTSMDSASDEAKTESDDERVDKGKNTESTYDPEGKIEEVQRGWSNKIAIQRLQRYDSVKEQLGSAKEDYEREEHLRRRWFKKASPETMTRKRHELEMKYNPLYRMLNIDPIIIADSEEIVQDSDAEFKEDDDEDDGDAKDRAFREMQEKHRFAVESDSEDDVSKRRGKLPADRPIRDMARPGHHFTPPQATSSIDTPHKAVELSSDGDSEPVTEDDDMDVAMSGATPSSFAASSTLATSQPAQNGIPEPEPESESDSEPKTESDSEPETESEIEGTPEPDTEDDGMLVGALETNPALKLGKEDDDSEDEPDYWTKKTIESQKKKDEEERKKFFEEALSSSVIATRPSSTPGDAVKPEDRDEDEPELSLEESQRIASQNRLSSIQKDLGARTILRGYRPEFGATEEQLKIGSHKLMGSPKDEIPASINRFLREYQRQGIDFLYSQYKKGLGGILGDDMGLGKTIQVIGFLCAVMRKTGRRRDDELYRKRQVNSWGPDEYFPASSIGPTCLIVCPASLVENWKREIETWSFLNVATLGTKKIGTMNNNDDVLVTFRSGYIDVLVGGYEHVEKNMDQYKSLDISIVIADEVHRLKSPKAKLTKRMSELPTRLRYGLTGTAVQNRISEFHTILDWACPGHLGTIRQWRDLVETPIKFAQKATADESDLARGRLTAIALVTKVLPNFFLRRTKNSVKLQLPKKTDNLVLCPLTIEQRRAYQNLLNSKEVQLMLTADEPCPCGRIEPVSGDSYQKGKCCYQGWSTVIFKYMHVFIKLANHLALIYPDKEDLSSKTPQKYYNDLALMKEAFPHDCEKRKVTETMFMDPMVCGKWQVLNELLEVWYEAGDKVLIFSNSLKVLHFLEGLFQASSFDWLTLTGATRPEDRLGLVDEFNKPQGKTFCFLISTKAGGVGLNLTAANKVVIFDPSFNPSHDMQAMDRSYRFGQTREVQVYRFVGAGTIEELIVNRQHMKRGLANVVYDGRAERRNYEGIEGEKAHRGELFGVKNLFQLRSASLTKQIVTKAGEDDATYEAGHAAGGEEQLKGADELAKAQDEDGDEPYTGAKEVINEVLGGALNKATEKSKGEAEILEILSKNSITLDADKALGPSKAEEERGKAAMAKQLQERHQNARRPAKRLAVVQAVPAKAKKPTPASSLQSMKTSFNPLSRKAPSPKKTV